MLRTNEAALIANVGMAAFIAHVRVNAIREAMGHGSWDSPEVREWTAAALDTAAAELTQVHKTLNALYRVAPPCNLGDDDAKRHSDVAWERAKLIRVCPGAFSKKEIADVESAGATADIDLTEGLEASGWKNVESADLPEGVTAFVPGGER